MYFFLNLCLYLNPTTGPNNKYLFLVGITLYPAYGRVKFAIRNFETLRPISKTLCAEFNVALYLVTRASIKKIPIPRSGSQSRACRNYSQTQLHNGFDIYFVFTLFLLICKQIT